MAFLDSQGVSKLCALLKDKFDNVMSAVNRKQDALTAGANITINDGVISADGGSDYTAGNGIEIDSNGVISTIQKPPRIITVSSINNSDQYGAENRAYIANAISDGLDNYPFIIDVSNYGNVERYIPVGRNRTQIKMLGITNKEIVHIGYIASADSLAYSFQKLSGSYFPTGLSATNAPSGNASSNIGQELTYIKNNYATKAELPEGLPTDPSTDGTYKLTSTITSGTPTYSWEADSGSSGGSSEYYAGLSVPYAFFTDNTWGTDYRFAAAEFADVHSNNEAVSLIKQGVAIRYQVDSSFVLQDHMEEIFGPASAIDPSTSVYTCRIGKSGPNYIPNYQSYNSNSNTINQTIRNGTWYFLRINRMLFYWSKNIWSWTNGLAFIKDFLGISTGSSLPSAPSTDGDYILKCSVSSGTPTYSWESVMIGGSY